MKRIYLDYNASTPMSELALERMAAVCREVFGNSSSHHAEGRAADAIVEEAREALADGLGCAPKELIFTSGGTESDNLALFGFAERFPEGRIITAVTEHHAVLESAEVLEERGYDVVLLDVDGCGRIAPGQLQAALEEKPETQTLVSLMLANNEIGLIHDVPALAEVAHGFGARFHTDAVNAYGKVPVDVEALGVDLLSVSAHKFGGPKGIGALYLREGTRLARQMHGGSHERKRRAGTLNTPGVAGLLGALETLKKDGYPTERIRRERDRLYEALNDRLTGVHRNGDPTATVPNTLNVSFDDVDGRTLLTALDLEGLAISGGSACASGAVEPSHVIKALGVPEDRAHATVRFSLGPGTKKEEIDRAIEIVVLVVERLR